MRKLPIGLAEVREVYAGPERRLWELIMGEQIHAGGFAASMRLAEAAGIQPGLHGVDLCSCVGGGVRFLVKFRGCTMVGVDGTPEALDEAVRRAEAEGVSDRAEFRLGDVVDPPCADEEFDFVWGEDAWCYVDDKAQLIEQAFRMLKPGGTIAFTDWIEGPAGLAEADAERICTFMKFPYVESLEAYVALLERAGFGQVEALDLTDEFAGHVGLYIRMLTEQLTFDALRILGDDVGVLEAMGAEMAFMHDRCLAGAMGKGQFVARKT